MREATLLHLQASRQALIIFLLLICTKYAESKLLNKIPPCNHDKIADRHPYIVEVAGQGEGIHKRGSGYANIRIHPILTVTVSRANEFFHGENSPLSRAIDTLQRLLFVRPVQGNLTIQPICEEYASGLNKGKCMAPLPSQDNYKCGRFGAIPHQYIGTREVCDTSNSLCTTEGPNGTGLPNADYLLFVSVSSIASCYLGTLAFASYCMLDAGDYNRPVVGYINVCPSALDSLRRQPGAIYGLLLHEIIHALGFSSRLFDKFVDDDGNTYNPAKKITGPYGSTYVFAGPKTLAFARQYYACDDIKGVYLENEGGSGTASSHWDKRTLNHELMTGYISNDYDVLSKFTLLLLEDSGWYKVDYTALDSLRQNSLQWGKGLGCSFLTERCTNKSVFPYLCNTNETQLVCTYDHLSKGSCSTKWKGFDGCAVALANIPEHYCRVNAASQFRPFEYVEAYGDSSICVDGIRSLSCSTLRMSHCMVHETYTVNGSYQYALQFQNEQYRCQDGHVLTTDHYFIPLCPPAEEVVSRSPSVLNARTSLSSSTVAITDLSALKHSIQSGKNIVAFGKLSTFRSVNIKFYVNSKQNNSKSFICLSAGCKTCTAPLLVDNTTSVLTTNRFYTVARGTFAASAVFVDSSTQSRDYTLVLMSDLQANHSFVYYAASINFVGDYLQELHSNDDFYIRVIALVSNTEIRIAPNQDVYIDESYYIFHRDEIVYNLGSGEAITISSKKDLTGTRVTANRAVSLYSGHYCTSGKTTACSILHEQIPPYNSWGNTFVLHTNVNGIRGNMFKIIASDVGANALMNCTTDGTDYKAYGLNLGFRQHRVFSLTHDYCTVKSDRNILIIQFRDSSPPLMDTFMTIIPALVHYEDNYVLNAHEGFDNCIAITVKGTDVATNSILLDDDPIAIAWTMIELDGDAYYFGSLALAVGRHSLAFSKNSFTFGVILYGSNEIETFALPVGLRIDAAKILVYAAPSSVGNARVTLVDRVINITWSPPSIANGMILQYIVHEMSSSGESYHHIPADQNSLELPYFKDALVFVAAVNQYGQSSFKLAKSSAPCKPSPCINNGECVANYHRQHCNCGDASFGKFCESTQMLYPFGLVYNDTLLPSSDDSHSPLIHLSKKFVFYNKKSRIIYVNTNGIISFERPFLLFSTRSLPLRGTDQILAPYMADVDTTGTGKIFYRQTVEPIQLARASSEIQRAYGLSQNFTIKSLFIATWSAVGFFPRRTDKTNTFQCILASSQYESFVMFLYADIQWTSAGALAGINAGDGLNHITLPRAQASSMFDIQKMSNVGVPGVWIFKIGEDCRPNIYTCVSELYPFGLTHGDAALSDIRSPKIQLSKNFYFYKEVVRVTYINDNGIISFNNLYNHPFPLSLPLRGNQQIIAPYWADVDTRGTGKIYYRQSSDPILLARASREIRTALSLAQDIQIKNLLITTWDAVGYYNKKTEKVNTFQCILATSEIESFVIFLYSDLQWTTGDSSFGTRGLGGFKALAGYNAGDKINSHTIAGSRTSKIIEIARTSNVGIPGTWIFKVGQDCSRRFVRDVVFVIDTSSSIGSSRFQLVRELTGNITSRLKVNSPESLFGLITFDNFARYKFDISAHTNLSTLLPAINPGIPYHGGGSTNTASALSLLLSGGREGGYLHLRTKTSNVAIVITDGFASNYSLLHSAANSLHPANIFDVYAVGIGNNNYNELQLIASDPSLVFSINSLTKTTAEQLVEDVIDKLCSTHAPKIYLRPSYYLWKGALGEPHDLICLIAVSSTAQSSSVKLAWKFIRNDTRVRVIPTTITTDGSIGIIYTTVIRFDYLMEEDEGKYRCALRIDGDSAESTFNLEIINPIFAIDLTAAIDPEINQPLKLQCSATIVRDITSTVDIIWTTDNTQVRRVNNVTASSNINSSSIYNDSFIIPSLSINDVRNVYHCEILINSVLSNAAKANFTISIPGRKCLNSSIQDLVFVIDASSSIGSSHFQLIRKFTANIASKLIHDSPKSSFAVILFNTNAHVRFTLQTYTSPSSLLSAINNLPYYGGGTNTAEALTLLLSTAKNGTLGLRNDSSKVAIVITGGPSDHHNLTLSAATELHNSNIFNTIIAVRLKTAVVSELEMIASSPKLVILAHAFDTIHLQQLSDKVLLELCDYGFLSITLQPSGSNQNTVGQRQDVICSISVPPEVDPVTIELGWLNKEDIVTDVDRVTIYTSTDYSDYSPLASTIQFDPLIEEDQGEYTCYAMINGLFLFQPINIENFKIPISLVQITIFDNETLGLTNLAIGDPLTLDFTVTTVKGISSSVNIVWTTGGIELRRVDNITADVVNDSAIYTDSFEISSLSAIDNGREYQCTVMINAKQPIYSNDKITVVLNAPTCFNTTNCEGGSFSDNSLSYVQCCFELSGASFALSGECLLCPKDEGCDPTTATCITEFYFFGLPENDDVLIGGTSRAVMLSENFYFYDQTVRVVYLGDNGIISINDSYNDWTPKLLPFSSKGFVAPYWADVDLRGAGQIYYRQTKNPVLLARATYEIQKVFPLPYPFSQYLIVTNLFIVTWDAVGYYSEGTDKTNTFQCVLASTITDSFVMFLYADGRIQWTTGDDSDGINGLGGTEALAGINAGDGVNSVTIPGSLTPGIINITQTSNVNNPGLWIFKVGEGYRCSGNSVKDVVFVIDMSLSISYHGFQLIKEFVAKVTTELIRNSPRSAVGVILFEEVAHIEFNLQAHDNFTALISAINNLPYNGGGTDTAEALTLLLSTAQDGTLGLRSDSSKVAIVITSGPSDNQSATSSATTALHASNIFEIVTVGIVSADLTELLEIASNRQLVFNTDSFDMLKFKNKILIRLCIDQTIPNIFNDQNTVGQRQNVICSISVPPDMDPDTIELGWLNEEDIVTDDSRVTIIRSSNHSANISSNFNTIITTVIQFEPLFEDDKGNYSCYSIANKSVKYISTPLNNFTIPNPLMKISIFDDDIILGNESVGTLILGDPLRLDCTVTAVRGISSSVNIVWTTGGRVVRSVDDISADLVNDSATYHDSFEIPSLSAIDNETEYKCTVMINTTQPIFKSIQVMLIFSADIDECTLNIDDCDQLCVNDIGSYHCDCYDGYFGDNNSCIDINECAEDHGCHHLCNNTDGSFHCYCNPGYMLHSNGTNCTDINECLIENGGCEFSCTNLEGINSTTGVGYQCGCDYGYQLASNNHDCDDIPNCVINDHNCSQICVELEGSFSCFCYPGYELQEDGATCLDIDECIEGTDGCDHNCTNTDGSYYCTCMDGYELDSDNHTCTDINECARGIADCHHICNNNAGSYFCTCNTGYASTLDHKYCIAACPAGCFNGGNCSSPGICTCHSGWTGSNCAQDIDECTLNIDDCNQLCVNDIGSYHCECYDGYIRGTNSSSCVDINECAGDHGCHHLCNNTDGSFHCYCNPGYMLHSNGTTCIDINECLVNNGGCEFSCTNLEGINNTTGLGYQCECDYGYQLAPDNHNCNDINECLVNNGTCFHNCVNTEGSYNCKCVDGYVLQPNKRDCEDINECHTNNGGCDQICINIQGSFECSCNTSYTLAKDNKTCVPYAVDCDYVLETPSGYVNTPGFPNSLYAPFLNCTWIIELPAYKRIELKFDVMDIEDSPDCTRDRLTILNGKDGDSLSLGSYCGNKIPATIESSTESVTIKFISDGTISNKGFSLEYRGLKKRSKDKFACYLAESKNTVFGLSTFPSKYNGPVNCIYFFFSPSPNRKVKITFLYLDILAADCNTDRIEISDGFRLRSVEKICNGSKIIEFISKKQIVRIAYVGKSVGKYRGFHAAVTFL